MFHWNPGLLGRYSGSFYNKAAGCQTPKLPAAIKVSATGLIKDNVVKSSESLGNTRSVAVRENDGVIIFLFTQSKCLLN